jgi:hypothetical protein
MSSLLSIDFFALYSRLLDPFRNSAFGPELATVLLALALIVLLGFICFATPQAIRLRSALATIVGKTVGQTEQQKRVDFLTRYREIDEALYANRTTSAAWQEYRKCLIARGVANQRSLLASNSPLAFFNPRSLGVQYEFVRSLPNFFVGLGLLGTFVGLIAALTFATQSLADANNQEQIKSALKELLSTAAAKFYISAAGLVSSLLLAFLIRLFLKHLHSLVGQINRALEERVQFISAQAITERQLVVQQSSLEELRLFNTNIAMKIGDAVSNAIERGNEHLTSKLADVANSFEKLIEASRADTGNAVNAALKGALDSTLRQASEAIGSVASSLQDLPTRLTGAANAIQIAGDNATRQQEKVAEKIQSAIDVILRDTASQVAAKIDAGTQNVLNNLNATGAVFGDSATKISSFLSTFEDKGVSILSTLGSLRDQHAELEENLSAVSSQLVSASEAVGKATAAVNVNLITAIDGIREFSRVAADTHRAAMESQETIRLTVETLRQQMSQHIQRFDSVDEKLAGVFNSIISHVEEQSRLMSEQFSHMDTALANAVNQFEQLIVDLTDVTAGRAAAE